MAQKPCRYKLLLLRDRAALIATACFLVERCRNVVGNSMLMLTQAQAFDAGNHLSTLKPLRSFVELMS